MVIDKVGSNRTVTHLLPPEVRRIAPRPTFDPGQSGISGAHDARMFMVGPPVVPGVQVLGKKGELRFIPEDVVAHGLNTNYFLCRTEASESSQIYVISKEIFKDHLTQIFNHSVYDSTLRLDKLSKPGEKDLFIAARDVAMANTTTPEKLFYYSFMINEATNEGIDYLSAAATMLTDLPDSAVRQFTASLPAKAKDQAKEISTILQRFNRLEKTRYLPPQGRQNNLIQNHMDALICIAQGDGRAVLMRLLHRLSRLKMINKASAAQIKSTREIYAPFAERFGLYHIALELQENAFRVEQEIECAANAEHKNKYIASENEIMWTLGFTDRPEAEAYLAELTARFAHANPNAEVDGRVKGAWSAYAKLEYKPDEYPDILYMVDLMGERAIEDGPLCSMKDAQARVQATLGNNFKDFNYENNQTETRTMEIDGITIKYHYVSAITKDDKAIEFQFITKEDFKILTFGQKAHWAYKLKMMTEQKFDLQELKEYGKRMTGDFFHDVQVINDYLSEKWVYLFATSSRSKDCQRVIRREKGSIMLDAAARLLGDNIRMLKYINARKIWQDKGMEQRAGNGNLIETGDFVEPIMLTFGQGLRHEFMRDLLHAQHLGTKLAIFASVKKDLELAKLTSEGHNILFEEAAKRKMLPQVRSLLTTLAEKKEIPSQGIEILIAADILKVEDVLTEIQTLALAKPF